VDAVGGFRFHKRCVDGGCICSRTQIRDISWDQLTAVHENSRTWTDADLLFKKAQFWIGLNYLRNLVISRHDIALNPLLATLIQQTTNNVMMQPWLNMLKVYGLLKVHKSLWTPADSRSNIASACGCGRGSLVEIRGLTPTQHMSIRTSLVSTSTATRCTTFPRWMVTQRCTDSSILPRIPSSVLHLRSRPRRQEF